MTALLNKITKKKVRFEETGEHYNYNPEFRLFDSDPLVAKIVSLYKGDQVSVRPTRAGRLYNIIEINEVPQPVINMLKKHKMFVSLR